MARKELVKNEFVSESHEIHRKHNKTNNQKKTFTHAHCYCHYTDIHIHECELYKLHAKSIQKIQSFKKKPKQQQQPLQLLTIN